MCVPSIKPSPQTPIDVPSQQAASNLQIGGSAAPRGAAQLGRLALRFGGTASSASPASSSAASSLAAPVSPPPVAPGTAGPAAEAQQPGVGTSPGSLAGLRFGNFNPAFS